MAAIANIVVPDGAAVSKTFYVSNAAADTSRWEERSSSQYIGYNRITLQLKRPTANQQKSDPANGSYPANRNLRLVCKVETPILETLSTAASGIVPAPIVSYRPVCEMIFTLPERSTLADRKTILSFANNVLGNAAVINAVWNFDMPY